jgi:hypothetical protein
MVMAVKRKGNPNFILGKDSLGRPSWLTNPAAHVDISGLRSAVLVDEVPRSELPFQRTEVETMRMENYVDKDALEATREMSNEFIGSAEDKAIFGSAGLVLSGSLFAIGGVLVAAPAVALIGGAIAVQSARKFAVKRRAKQAAYKRYTHVPYQQYESEAKEMVKRFPHWYTGERDPISIKVYSEGVYTEREAVCSVDKTGVGEVKWNNRTESGRRKSGKYLLYPGINMQAVELLCPMEVPGVNLRGANMERSQMRDGSVLDGADLRDVNASRAGWDSVSLRYANCQNANFSHANIRNGNVHGADFTGADLTGAQLPIDLTGTNITSEQFITLRGAEPGNETIGYRVPEVTIDEILQRFDGDRDAMEVAMWSGDVEVRDRTNSRIVTSGFDPVAHYIPAWELDV